ncbi:MAG: hypothetical protein K0Q59_2144, partial [Paenibacillus sp.]|nr:hypothetical protein [Paenibacillus sp.]
MNENGSGIQVRLGVIGMSKRGKSLIRGCYAGMPDVVIKAVCDIYEDRVREAVELVKQLCGHEAAGYT